MYFTYSEGRKEVFLLGIKKMLLADSLRPPAVLSGLFLFAVWFLKKTSPPEIPLTGCGMRAYMSSAAYVVFTLHDDLSETFFYQKLFG